MAAFQQSSPTPLTLGEEVLLLYAASLGMLDAPVADVGDEGVEAVTTRILEHVKAKDAATLDRISESGLLSEAAKERLAALIAEALE